MKLSTKDKQVELGRTIARELNKIKVQQKENMAKAVQRREETLKQAAEDLFK